jgi:hypothetical protein
LDDIKRLGGTYVLHDYYASSLPRALKQIYPDYEWQLWRFQHLGHDTFQNELYHREFLDNLGKFLQLDTLDDWYKVSDIISNYCMNYNQGDERGCIKAWWMGNIATLR